MKIISNTSVFYLDKTVPKGSLLVECGRLMERAGYKIKVFNTINFKKSMHYNPFAYIHSEKEMIDLDNTLRAHIVRNQTIRVRGENGGDVSVFAAEYGLTNAPDDKKAIEIDPIANATEQTYIDRMLENAEKLH